MLVTSFGGQVALVTGAGSGVGLATAKAFAKAGAAVVLADRDEEAVQVAAERLAARGRQALAVRCDVTDDVQVADMVERAVATFGSLDVAFNNAGVVSPPADTADVSTDEWDRVLSINLRGVWTCMVHELRQMVRQGSGAIVNCSSMGGLTGVPGMSAYTASKHGVIGLTRSAALEYVSRGIRINAICPGVIDTPMTQKWTGGDRQTLEALEKEPPIGRFGTPREIADAVLWLCSPASSYMVGHALPVDGGITA